MFLETIQREFVACLTGETEFSAVKTGKPAVAGMRVYLNNYRSQLLSCLEGAFPVTRSWLGDDMFQDRAVAHIRSVPPSLWTLDGYPSGFPDTLRRLLPSQPVAYELARMELALADAFVARDQQAIAISQVQDVDWDQARISFSPSLQTWPVETNAAEIWSAISRDSAAPAPVFSSDGAVIVCWRRDFTSCFREIEREEYRAIGAALRGDRFTQICSSLVERHGERDGVNRSAQYLRQWFDDGLIVEVS